MDTNRPFQFQKCSQLFIGTHNEMPSFVTVRVSKWSQAPQWIASCILDS